LLLCGESFSGTVTQEVAIAALQALDAVHACGLLHGDVEVRYFIVGPRQQPSVHLLDFRFYWCSSNKQLQMTERMHLEHLLADMVL